MIRRIVGGCVANCITVGRRINRDCVRERTVVSSHSARLCAAEDHVQRGFGAQDGAADGLGDLRHHRIAESLDDQARRKRPFAAAERKARASQPGGNPIIHA